VSESVPSVGVADEMPMEYRRSANAVAAASSLAFVVTVVEVPSLVSSASSCSAAVVAHLFAVDTR
jgi:hypothetical protein